MKLASGHEVVPLGDEELERRKKDFPGCDEPWIRILPGRWLFPRKFLKFAERIYNFEIRQTDVVLMTYPKCGTTWTQELIWTMRNNPHFNHPLSSWDLSSRAPFIDFDMFMPVKTDGSSPNNSIVESFKELCIGKNPDDGVNLQLAEAVPDPRTIKTHLPFSLMPPSLLDTAKVVYVARNPKDVVISFHHHTRIAASSFGYAGSFEDFVQYFLDDDLPYGPYWYHLKEAWEKRNHPHLHILFYEDLKANLLEELKRLDVFLETHLTEEQLKAIGQHAAFDSMKERWEALEKEMSRDVPKGAEVSESARLREEYVKKEGGFFRKGEVGDWKTKLASELNAKIDRWTRDHLSNLGINFKYSI